MKLTNQLLKLSAGLLISCVIGNAQALTIRWSISDTTFYDGTSVTGYFDYSTVSSSIVNRNVITQAGDLSSFTYNNSNDWYSFQEIDTANVFLFESYIRLPTPQVDVTANTKTSRWFSIINSDSSGFNLDLSQAVTYTIPLNGSVGFENIRTWNYDDFGAFLGYSDNSRYINSAVTLNSTILSPIPEPETYAMLLVGLGLIGCSVRRRKDHTA